MSEAPELKVMQRIQVGRRDCIVKAVYQKGSDSGAGLVVFIRDNNKPTAQDVAWNGSDWYFPDRSDRGGYTQESDPCVQALRGSR